MLTIVMRWIQLLLFNEDKTKYDTSSIASTDLILTLIDFKDILSCTDAKSSWTCVSL